MLGLFCIVISFLIIVSVYLLFQAVGGILVGAKIEEINFFSGSPIFSFQVGKVTFKLNYFPNGTSIKFSEEFTNIHPLKKIVAVLVGLSSFFVLSLICLGATETLHQISTGYSQLFWGVISPVETGSKLIEALSNLFVERSFYYGLGVFSAKFFSMNSLPLGLLNGGYIVLLLLELVGFKSERFNDRFGLFGLLILVLMFLGWLVAFAVFLWRTIG